MNSFRSGILSLIFRESFVPVLLVGVALFLVLLYASVKTDLDAEQAIVIEIRDVQDEQETASGEDRSISQVQFSPATKDDKVTSQIALLVESGKWQEAETILQQQLKLHTGSPSLNDLGVLFFQQAQYEKALQYFRQAVETQPVLVSAYLNKGLAHARLKQYPQAVDAYRKLIAQVPFHFEGHFNMGVALLKNGDFSGAAEVFDKAASMTGGVRKAKSLYNRGLAYKKQGRDKFTPAEKSFRAAIRIRPDYIEARLALIGLEPDTRLGRENALAQFEKIL
ncbi:MAG: tetratricopeptide repeat protein, partial [Xanthomonadales bacterium]|nr:tetratricopeptide repeat protein [Xanthomonadales bacterium]